MRGLMRLHLCAYMCGSGNKIGDEGGSAIGAGLATNSTLTKLNLGGECSVMMVYLWRGCEGGEGGAQL